MIEMHQKGRSRHILVDADGWQQLKAAIDASSFDIGRQSLGVDVSAMYGIDIFRADRDGCPCQDGD